MEIVFTLGVMAFLGTTAFVSFGLTKDSIAGDALGASGFPLMMVGLGLLLCMIQLFRELRTKTKKDGEKLIDLSNPAGRAVAYTALSLVAYVMLLNFLGFILSTFVFALVCALVMGYRKKGKLVVFALVTTIALFLLFGKAFFVPLPRGVGFLKEISYLLY